MLSGRIDATLARNTATHKIALLLVHGIGEQTAGETTRKSHRAGCAPEASGSDTLRPRRVSPKGG